MTEPAQGSRASWRARLGGAVYWIAGGFAWLCGFAAGWYGGIVPLICCLVIAAMTMITPDPDYVPAHAFDLPGVHDGPPPVLSVGAHTHLIAIVLGSAAVAVLTYLGAGPAIAVAVVLMVALVTWLRSAPRLVGRRHLRKVSKALARYEPSVAMPFAGRLGGPWQLGQWEPAIVDAGERVVLINVHDRHGRRILDQPDIVSPMVQLGSRGTLELRRLLPPSVRAMFYVQNSADNLGFLALDDLTHVWLGHGDSDKPGSHNAQHARFDLVVVAGQAAVDRYARHGVPMPSDKLVAVGRPQTRDVEVRPATGTDHATATVLYAPTWHGTSAATDFSSLSAGPTLVHSLLRRGATVVFRPHPFSIFWSDRRELVRQVRTMLARDRQRSGRPHVYGRRAEREWSLADCINHSDAVVTDVSAVASDVLASGKPYAMTCLRGDAESFRRSHPVAESAYVILGDMRNIDDVLDDLLFHDPLALARSEQRAYVLSDLDGEQSAEAFTRLVRGVVGAS